MSLQVDPHLTRFIAELKLRDASASEPMDLGPPEPEELPLPTPPTQARLSAEESEAKVHPCT